MESQSGRLLRRSRTNRMLLGVCGGIGEYLGVDPNLVRLAVAVLSLLGGSGAALYLVGWLLIPDEGANRSVAQELLRRR